MQKHNLIKVISTCLFLSVSFLSYGQRMVPLIEEEHLLEHLKDSDLYLLKLSANTKDTQAMIVTLDTWFKFKYHKPKTINGKTYTYVLERDMIDYKNHEIYLKEIVYYNNAGEPVGQSESTIPNYKAPIPGSLGEYMVEQATLKYESVLMIEEMEKQN